MKNKVFIYIMITLLCQQVISEESQMFKEGTCQIHLDFHTSGQIENIGVACTKEQFKETLKVGKVHSINIFAKGHHGYSYDNIAFGKRHPHLKFDLFEDRGVAEEYF